MTEDLGTKKYGLGLVVGKFAPLHQGHEALIDHASKQCERLLILSYTQPEFERCGVMNRRKWLTQRFPQHESVVIDDHWLHSECQRLGLPVQRLPDNSEDDATQQAFLAWLLEAVLSRKPDAMFCSESYGPPCAALLTHALAHPVQAVVVDLHRTQHPISASEIRRAPLRHLGWLSPPVRAAFVPRICLLGGESTGKTTLAAALARHFGCDWVPEYGRELWERKNGVLTEADLLDIAREQVRREDEAAGHAQPFLFCDTSPLTTWGYSLWMFGRAPDELAQLAQRPYDLYVLCEADFPFVQDGTRRDEKFRATQQAWYENQLSTRNNAVARATGSLAQRVGSMAEYLHSKCLVSRVRNNET
jgi:HTH-type transcriptional regulator, transcriptional repressor of NAD biosynthesis genes